MLGAVSPCLCYMPWFIGAPMAYVGLYKAFNARNPQANGTTQTLTNLALISNGIGAALGTMFMLVALFYIVYMVFVFGVIGLAGLSGH